MFKTQQRPALMTSTDFFRSMKWIDRTPLLDKMEPYRLKLFEQFFDERDDHGNLRYNLGLFGRAKKNWKTSDLVLSCFLALLLDSPGGNQVYIIANDADQAGDDLELAKKLRKANPLLADWTTVKKNTIVRKDGNGFIEVLAAGDAVGSHGKTFRLLAVDEVHGYRDWDLLEALSPDPHRRDCQTLITSYASLHHKPGVPLFDLMKRGKGGEPRMLFSWYGGDFTTDPDFVNLPPEQRANPSMASWGDNGEYIEQQRRRLPSHKFRRLHLNLPGTPEGSAYSAETVMDAVERGVKLRAPERGVTYFGFVDMSGGSSDDACLAVAHVDERGIVILDRVLNQGPPPPFDPRAAVTRFVEVLREYRIGNICGDAYAGQTFRADFAAEGIGYSYDIRQRIDATGDDTGAAARSKSELYEALEPLLNRRGVVLLDEPRLEEQFLGLVWRGGRIDHPNGEHDDFANACAGSIVQAAGIAGIGELDKGVMRANAAAPSAMSDMHAQFYGGVTPTRGIGDVASALGFGGGGSGFDLGRKAFGD